MDQPLPPVWRGVSLLEAVWRGVLPEHRTPFSPMNCTLSKSYHLFPKPGSWNHSRILEPPIVMWSCKDLDQSRPGPHRISGRSAIFVYRKLQGGFELGAMSALSRGTLLSSFPQVQCCRELFFREREQGLISGTGTSHFSVPRSLCSLRDHGESLFPLLAHVPYQGPLFPAKNCENGYLAHKKAPLP